MTRASAEVPHDALLSVQGLHWSAGGVPRLQDASFVLRAGERVMVLGANGAGKSVLLRLCHGLLAPDAGTLAWRDDATRQAQAMVFQQPVLLRASVLDNVLLALHASGLPAAQCRQRALDALTDAGLAAFAQRPARSLSGGERQRVALARARVLRPALLWLDEPTASLDPASTLAVERGVLAAHGEGTTVVMTTHDIGQARRLATRVLFVATGRLVCDAPARAFFDAPPHPAAMRYLAGELDD